MLRSMEAGCPAASKSASTALLGLDSSPTWPQAAGLSESVAARRPGEGAWVGPYRLVEPLGAGGQAVVWRARRGGPDGPEVALKILTGGPARDHRRVARLRREAERGARISHPSLLPAYEFGAADGVAFLAMELIEGATLEAVIARRRGDRFAAADHWLARLPAPRYARAIIAGLTQVARAVHAAHAVAVAHRDIKPSNILLRRDRVRHWAVLADLGLARDLEVATPAQLRDWSGSPAYMAPEKLRGVHEDEVSCDIYALGVTLYEALTLGLPRRAPAGLAGPPLLAHLAQQDAARPRPARPGLDQATKAIILRAMASRPAGRHLTAAAFAADLEWYLEETSPTGHDTIDVPRAHAGSAQPA